MTDPEVIHDSGQKTCRARGICWMEEGRISGLQRTIVQTVESNRSDGMDVKEKGRKESASTFWLCVVRNTLPDIFLGSLLLCITLLVQDILLIWWSPYEVCTILCVCTCSLTMVFLFHYSFVRRHHIMLLSIFLSFVPPSTYFSWWIAQILEIESSWRQNPTIGVLKSSIARACGFFMCYMLHSATSHLLKRHIKEVDSIKVVKEKYHSQPKDDLHPEECHRKGNQRSRVVRIVRDSILYGTVMSILLFLSSFILTIGSVLKPKSILEQELWSIVASGFLVPWCAILFKWTLSKSLSKGLGVSRADNHTANKKKATTFVQTLLVSSKSVELFFNLVKVSIVLMIPNLKDVVLVGSLSVLSQLITLVYITKHTSKHTHKKQLWLHGYLDEHILAKGDDLPVVGWRKFFGVASMSRHPSLYQGFSLWSCVLVHEYHANLAAVIISFIYLAFRDQYALASLSLRACFLIAAYSAKMAALHKILPHCMPSDKRLCSSLYSAHGLMPSLATRAGALVWLVCTVPFIVQNELHHHYA